jgi:aminoglycoside 3-N-acetyltransferase
MPTFTLSFQPLDKAVLDMVNSKSEVGIITEVFRKRPGVIRSEHLVHSVAVWGKRAKEVLGDGILPCGKGSPFEFMLKNNAWNLFLGAGMNSCTSLHKVEEFLGVPYRYYKEYPGSFVIRPDGTKIPSRSKEYVKHPGFLNDFEKIEGIFNKEGILKYSKAGSAKIIAVRTKDIFNVTKKYFEKDSHFLVRKEK